MNRQLVSRVFLTSLALLLVIGGFSVNAADTEAIARCHQLYNQVADTTSAYVNYFCRLDCRIKGQLYPHPLNEGLRCPLADTESMICKAGQCVAKNATYGRINLELRSASLSTPINGYATACVLNSTEKVSLPMRDRSRCVDCLTTVQTNTAFPVWNWECANFYEKVFTSQSTLAVEVWHHVAKMSNQFKGGSILELPQLSANKQGEWQFDTLLDEGDVKGSVKVHFKWTPLA